MGESGEEMGRAETMVGGRLTPADVAKQSAEIGDVIARRYELVELIGRGGVGAVYLAHDRDLDEHVALKLLRRELLSIGGAAELLRREVKLARRVTHRNVARTFDFGLHEQAPFLTMEYVDGSSLAGVIAQRGPLSVAEALPLLLAVCAGVEAAHGASVLHLDIKPDNIIVARDGRLVVTDFGLSRVSTDAGFAAALSGTPAYMAPEQVCGRPPSPRTDIYSLGVLAFEMFTGELPWRGDSVVALLEARVGVVAAPAAHERNPGVPLALSSIVQRAMAEDPADRPATVASLLASLKALGREMAILPMLARGSSAAEIPVVHRKPTIAVMCFDSRDGSAPDYLLAGFTQDLIDGLSEVGALRVLSRGASAGLESDNEELDARATALGVHVVVSGSLSVISNETAELRARAVSPQSREQLWAHRFQLPLAELLTAIPTIARALLDKLQLTESAPARSAMPTARALDLYMRARAAYRDMVEISTSIALYEEARELAPNSVLIDAGYARALLRRWLLIGKDTEQLAARASSAVERSLASAPGLGEVHLARGFLHFHRGDSVGAARAFREALARSPSLVDAHGIIGAMLTEMGRVSEARERLHTARSLDPTLGTYLSELQRGAALSGSQELERSSLSWPNDEPEIESAVGVLLSVRLAAYRRDVEQLRRMRDRLRELPEDEYDVRAIVDSLVGAMLGDLPLEPALEALRFTDDLVGQSARRVCFGSQLRAELAGWFDRVGEVVDAVELADSHGFVDLLWLNGCPLLDCARDTTRFLAVRETVVTRCHDAYDALWSPS